MAILLAKKAREEYLRDGVINMQCPKCKTIPKVTSTDQHCGRVTIRCECGYVYDLMFIF